MTVCIYSYRVIPQFVEQHPDSSLDLPGAPKGRLRELLREAIRTRNYSRRTEKTYWFWIRWFILFNDKRHPAEGRRGAPLPRIGCNGLLCFFRMFPGIELHDIKQHYAEQSEE